MRKSEKALKRRQKRVSKKLSKGKPQSNNYKKARNKLARKHLKVSRQRKDFAVKKALCVIQSNDVVVYEDLQVRNLVKNHKLAKSISDASWYQFRCWLEYFGKVSCSSFKSYCQELQNPCSATILVATDTQFKCVTAYTAR